MLKSNADSLVNTTLATLKAPWDHIPPNLGTIRRSFRGGWPAPVCTLPEAISAANCWPQPTHTLRVCWLQAASLSPAPPEFLSEAGHWFWHTVQFYLHTLRSTQDPERQQLASVCCVPFTEWPQAWHWCQIWICIDQVNTTQPTLVNPWDPISPN